MLLMKGEKRENRGRGVECICSIVWHIWSRGYAYCIQFVCVVSIIFIIFNLFSLCVVPDRILYHIVLIKKRKTKYNKKITSPLFLFLLFIKANYLPKCIEPSKMNIYLSFHIFLAHIVNSIDFIKKILYNIYIKEKKQIFKQKALTMLI